MASPSRRIERAKKGRGRFSDSEIASILRQHDAGKSVAELSRTYGISPTTFYNWRAKSAPPVRSRRTATEPERVAVLGEENLRLKRLLGEAALKISVLEETLAKRGQ